MRLWQFELRHQSDDDAFYVSLRSQSVRYVLSDIVGAYLLRAGATYRLGCKIIDWADTKSVEIGSLDITEEQLTGIQSRSELADGYADDL